MLIISELAAILDVKNITLISENSGHNSQLICGIKAP